jgi:selenide, water dikinase
MPEEPHMDHETTRATDARDGLLRRDQMSPTCGCQAKVGGSELRATLRSVPGLGASDPEDCAAIALSASDLLLASVDFGPLVGPDPTRAGRIAAFHAMSDVWAMGGVPRHALVIAVKDRALPPGVLTRTLSGLSSACAEEHVLVIGGHTTVGDEALIGLAILGSAGAHPLRKSTPQVRHALMLSKSVGTGMMLRAYLHGNLSLAALEPALQVMDRSNRTASLAAVAAGASAVTDVTGFGLLGHAAEMLAPTTLGMQIDLHNVPVVDGVSMLPSSYAHSAYIDQNLEYARALVRIRGGAPRQAVAPLLDPQTSGGLLATVPASRVSQMQTAGFHRIGYVTDSPGLEVQR